MLAKNFRRGICLIFATTMGVLSVGTVSPQAAPESFRIASSSTASAQSSSLASRENVSNVDQSAACALPQLQRTGAWICPLSPQTSNVSVPASAAYAPSHCNTGGCWYRDSDTQAEYVSTGVAYGYNMEYIGNSYMHISWVLNGTLFSETISARVTSASEYVEWTGTLNNGGHNVAHGGTIIHDCGDTAGPHTVAANLETQSPTGFCNAADSSNYDHNMYGEYSWEIDGVPGFYYMYGRSIVAHSTAVPSSFYDFDSVDTLPGNSYSSGFELF